MEQNAKSGKSYIQVFREMPTPKRMFLVGVAVSALFAFPVDMVGEGLILVSIAIAVGLAGLVGVIGLIVITVKEDSQRIKNGNGLDSLRIAFLVTAALAILGEAIFAGLSGLASIALIVLTMIRAKKDSDNGIATPVIESEKPTGLL
jgi:hypothetical protein